MLNCKNLDNFCTDKYKPKVINGFKLVWKDAGFFLTKFFLFKNKGTEIRIDVKILQMCVNVKWLKDIYLKELKIYNIRVL